MDRRDWALSWELLRLSPDGVMVLQALRGSEPGSWDFRWLYANQAAELLLGVDSGYLPGKKLREILPGVGGDPFFACWVRVLERGEGCTEEVRCSLQGCQVTLHMRVDRVEEGLAVWLKDVSAERQEAQALRQEREMLNVMIESTSEAICEELAARERMEEALRESEERYRLAARATHDVLWDWDVASGEMRWSTALGEVFGEVPAESEASFGWWAGRIHPEDRKQALEAIQAVMGGVGESWSSEYRFRRADDTYAVVLERGYVGRDREGKSQRLIGSMMDVSERKQMEQAMAREAELRERFIGILAHDLGSPIAAIRFSAQMMLMDGGLSPGQKAGLGRIERGADRVARMTRQLLDFTRARQGNGIPVGLDRVNLAAVCCRVISEFEATHPGRVIELEIEGDTQGLWDADRLEQALSNLLGNALDHGEETSPIHVRLWSEAGVQRLAVHNSGAPIEPALLPVLFEPFRRGEQRRSRRYGAGLGLGLYIVREIIRAHHGEVTVRSSQQEGTTFEFCLPRSAESGAREEALPGSAQVQALEKAA